MLPYNIKQLIQLALSEDIGTGDITTSPLKPVLGKGTFAFIAKDNFILAGTEVVKAVFKEIDPTLEVAFKYEDGDPVDSGARFGSVKGSMASVLTGERVALNFIQRLSGIATHTAKLVRTLIGGRINQPNARSIRITDTRKTIAGWRSLEKYAVRVGGGLNHRMGLYDAVLIKDNHIDAAGGIEAAISLVRAKIPVSSKIEVEARTLNEVMQALDAKADIIMLDMADLTTVVEACKIVDGRAKVELSGDIDENDLSRYAKLPIDYISVGSLTQKAPGIDISLKLVISG